MSCSSDSLAVTSMLRIALTLSLLFGAPAGTSPATTVELTAKIEAVLETLEPATVAELEQVIRDLEGRPESVMDDAALADELLRARVVLAWAQQDPRRAEAAMDEAIRSAAGRQLPVRGLGPDLKDLAKRRAAALATSGTASIEVNCRMPCQVLVNEQRSANPSAPLALGTYRVWVIASEGDADALRADVVLDVAGETERLEFPEFVPIEPVPEPTSEPEPIVPPPASKSLELAPTSTIEGQAPGDGKPDTPRYSPSKREKILLSVGGTLAGLSAAGFGTLIAGSVMVNRAERKFQAGPSGEDRLDANDSGSLGEKLQIAGGVTAGVLATTGLALIVAAKFHGKKQTNFSVLPMTDRYNFGLSIQGTF